MEIGEYIPKELYEVVAEILVFVGDMDRIRELICNGEEKFFRERMFYEERALSGEWVTDVKTMASQNISHKKPEEVPYIQSLQRVPVEVVKKGILSLADLAGNDALYDIVRAKELFDRELSFLVLEKDLAVG